LIGQKGLGKCVYIDWFNIDKAQAYWFKSLLDYLIDIPVDGLWTQNNEATNDIQGEIKLNETK
jgi:alpha-glucosidase (family GH31 glycosyl hydrolase)